jgi:hypothetical protein
MNLKKLEKRAYMAWHGDGLVDLALGGVVLLFGLGMQYDQTLLAPIFACMAYPLWLVGKKGITEKRFGYVEFSEERKQKEKVGMIVLLLMGCFTLMMGVMGYLALTGGGSGAGFMRDNGYLFLGIVFGLLSSSVGLVLGLTRLHAYSCLILACIASAHLMEWTPPVGVILPGSIIVVSGFALLVAFLRKYKPSEMEMGREEE